MPSIQSLNISPIQTTVITNQILVALDSRNNASAGYTISIHSKNFNTRTNGGSSIYQLKYNSHTFNVPPGKTRLLAQYSGNKPVKTFLQISNPSGMSSDTLVLTVASQ